MKELKIKHYLAVLTALLILYSCKYETLPTYSGIDQIYFAYADISPYRSDSLIVRFGYDAVMKDDSIIGITVKVMGSVTDYVRLVDFVLVDSMSTAKLGRDVDLLHEFSIVPPNSVYGLIAVRLKNTEALLNDVTLTAMFRLVENEFFKTDYTRTSNTTINNQGRIVSTQFHVLFDNANEMPNMWAHPTWGQQLTNFLGPYSRVKFAFMCEVLPGCTREYFTYGSDENPQTVFNTRFELGLIAGWARTLHICLERYKEEHDGEPLRDENGQEVRSGTAYI